MMMHVWIIDDSKDLIRDLIEYWEGQTGGLVKYSSFSLASSALELLHDTDAGPDIIFVDGQLDKDSHPLNRGTEVVARLKSLPAAMNSQIIAFSSNPDINDEMLLAGAEKAYWKMDYRQIGEYLHSIVNG